MFLSRFFFFCLVFSVFCVKEKVASTLQGILFSVSLCLSEHGLAGFDLPGVKEKMRVVLV